jgi:hypothetical protein
MHGVNVPEINARAFAIRDVTMKKLHLFLCLSLVAFIVNSSLAFADPDKSVRILVAKSDDMTAKVTLDSETYLVPITFENSSFNWQNDVKDGYSITPEFASFIKQGHVSIYIGCVGATFSYVAGHPNKK